MRILLAYRGIPQSPEWATGDSLCRAFVKLGHDVTPYGRYYSQPGPDGAGAGLCCRPLAKTPQDVDLAVILECGDGDPPYTELRALQCPKVFWDFDTELHQEFTKRWHAFIQPHCTFMANPRYLDMLPGARYLPYAADTALFRPGMEQRSGAAIIGHAFNERKEFATKIGADLISGVYREDYVAAMQRLRVHIHNHASGGNGLLVMRIFETMASGAVLLTEEDHTLSKHFKPGTHCVTYKNEHDCRKQLRGLLNDPTRCEAIASNALAEINERHTYECRARAILASL